jgi:hypothetical protein
MSDVVNFLVVILPGDRTTPQVGQRNQERHMKDLVRPSALDLLLGGLGGLGRRTPLSPSPFPPRGRPYECSEPHLS